MNTKILIILCITLFSLNFISAISITDVSSSPEQVSPGEIVDITIEIENIFTYDIENLNIKLNLENVPFAPYQSSSEKFLDELGDGRDESFRFKLITLPETKSGIYKIPVTINYTYNNDTSQGKTELISVIVNSDSELKVSSQDSNVLIKGKENIVSIKIVNSGLSDVKFVYASVPDISGIRFISEKEQYIGDIDSDDFDSISYKVYISESASSIVNLPVTLRFRDATNKEFTETQVINLRTYSLKEAQKLGIVKKPNYAIYIIIGGLIPAYIIYRAIKKKKRAKKLKGN